MYHNYRPQWSTVGLGVLLFVPTPSYSLNCVLLMLLYTYYTYACSIWCNFYLRHTPLESHISGKHSGLFTRGTSRNESLGTLRITKTWFFMRFLINASPMYICIYIYPVLCPKLTLIQPRWSAYPYHLVILIWYLYSFAFLIWYPYALTSLYGNTGHCSGYGVAMSCFGLFIVIRTAIVMSQWYEHYCFTEYAWMWVWHPATPWQRQCTAITDRQSIDFFVRFNGDLLRISEK